MLSFIRCVLIALPLFWVPSDSAEPLLETNSPPYTLVNFALEVDPRIDQIGEIQKQSLQNGRIRLNTQFSQRRKWLDAQFDNLSRKQKQIIKGFLGL